MNMKFNNSYGNPTNFNYNFMKNNVVLNHPTEKSREDLGNAMLAKPPTRFLQTQPVVGRIWRPDQQNLNQITKSNSVIIQNKNNVSNNNTTTEDGRSRWGPSIWYLFHTLSFKIKEEEFSGICVELLDIIKIICKNLPCPSCAQHATEYMQRLNYNSIQNKDDFKRFFFNFHNDVNKRVEKSFFSLEDFDNKYGSANTLNIIKNFMQIFQYKSNSFNMIANDMQRQRQIDLMKVWFTNNVNKFDN